MRLKNLEDLYRQELWHLHQAEKQSVRVLPALQRAAASRELVEELQSHGQQAREHIEQLKRILGRSSQAKGCQSNGVTGLVEDCLDVCRDSDCAPDVCEAAIVATLQHLKHYEIAGYGCVHKWASLLGNNEEVEILQKCLSEEKERDAQLSRVAEEVNRRAAAAGAGWVPVEAEFEGTALYCG